ncbi:DNA polymerase III polC-type [Anoxybacillus thermarum]|uniref:DNA polymerase III polC-type n=1 Tax=Anoxybacillus thermarum TaxID=404937 RepID=A0A0D0R205_9BACL|nr:3'-5' exonuclease [Anoxybacillus thermarum]KIQ95729.1 DNA polymerase III polC-type [Anoxybacillus thermarum]
MFFLRKAIDYKLNDNIPLSTPMDDIVFTVFDTETTGFDVATTDRLIEIGAVQVKGTTVLENEIFHTYVNPCRDIPKVITELTNITEEKVKNAPIAIEALQQFFDFVQQKRSVCFVGHYISFDLFVIKHELRREKMKFRKPTFIDTLDLIGFIAPSYDMRDLERYAQAFGTRMYERHSAIGDALTTAYLFVELLEQFRMRGYRTWGELLRATDSQMRSISF